LYVYNKKRGSIGSYSDNNTLVGELPTDTLDIFCVKGDTVYFRLNGGSGCYSYTFRYEMLSPPKGDIEPNNTFEEAVYFEQKDTVFGRVGYANVTGDSYDFFYSVLPDDGTLRVYVDKVNTSNSDGADFNLYVFNKNQGTIGSYSDNNTSVGELPTDTLDIFCVKGDTVYFRLYGGSGCYSYTLRYEMLSTSKSDSEQNNTLETSVLISPLDTLIGNIGHANGTFDNYDYFKFANDKRSTIIAYFKYDNTSNSTGADLELKFLNKAGGALLTKSYPNQALGVQVDTIVFNCAPTDTLHLRLTASACFNYSLIFEIKEEQPEAEILSARTGNDFGFIANTSHEDWIEWDFGNGVKSNFKYPSQSFDIGVYDVVLSARNTRCNIIKKDTLVIEVKGIESYMPQKSGEGGDFTMNIYGGGLDENTKITLTNGGSVLSPISKNGNGKRNLLLAEFDLHSADAGMYDVTIEIPGENPVVFPNGFQIEPIKYPVCKAEVSGPDTWRINRETNFELKVTNEGNINANGVAVGFVYPSSVSVSFIPKQARLPINGSTTIELDGEIITLPNSETSIFADSASVPIAITHLLGESFDGYMIYFLLPKVPANSTVSIPFKANSETAGSPNFYTYTHQPNMFGSCQTEHWSNTTNMIMAEGIDFLDMTVGEKNLPAKVFTKSLKIGQKHLALSGAYMGAKFDAWWNGYEMTGEMYGILSAELDEANAYGLKTAGEEAASELLSLGVGKALSQNKLKNQWWNETMANNMHLTPEKFDNFLDKVNALEAGSARIRRLEAMLSTVKSLKTLEDKRQALVKLVEECPELKKQLKDLIDLLDEELNQKDPNDKKTRTVRSMDPNAIYGPEGILDPRFKRSENAMHYMITCENVDTASASAQVVTIVDTLNPEYFDLNTFSFGTVFIGNKVTRLLNFRTEFYGEVDLNPEIPLVARVIAKIDKITGVISWTFIGIDENGELPRDPFMGVLPPNTNPPFGEAGVNYTVRLRADVPNGTVITNVADIIFDENEPIRTNTWKNVVDIVAPTSTIRELAVENDTIIKLAFTGADDGSGVADYKVYVSTDNGEWTPVGAVADDSLTLVGEPGRNYRFYVSTRDLVGNNENKDPISEAEISIVTSISEKSNPLQAIRIYPNPNNGQLYFNYHTDLGNFRVTIFDMLGKAVLSRSVIGSTQQTERLDISELTNGMYIVSFRDEKGNESSEKFILMK
ncbi:MAG TPA: T9SS type A sorting domain-containing protein, partial [Chitinophagales bacterium]|nr:T9SS type A sorting domain-containing protein [Chitinophagales bacterium]